MERNGLTRYDGEADLDRPFLWEGEHRYVECRGADGNLSLTLLLSQPRKQGDGGIWCVEGSAENIHGGRSKELPQDIQVPAAEYYADLQAQVDEGHRPGLLDPVQAAMDWYREEYGTEDLSGVSFTLLEGEPAGASVLAPCRPGPGRGGGNSFGRTEILTVLGAGCNKVGRHRALPGRGRDGPCRLELPLPLYRQPAAGQSAAL